MHREQSVKREKTNKMHQSDAYYQLLSQHVSGIIMSIFRRTKTVCYCIWCAVLVLLDVVGSGCGALRYRMRALWRLESNSNLHSAHTLQRSAPQPLPTTSSSTPYAVTHGLCSPEDVHNDARNMLRQKLIINICLLHLVGFLPLHALSSLRLPCTSPIRHFACPFVGGFTPRMQ